MNNLIVEPQCAPGCYAAPQILEFYSAGGISFIKQGRSRLFPALCRTFVRTDVRAIRIPTHRQNSIFANYSATFSHPPLFQMGCIVSRSIMNYFARRFSHSRTYLSFLLVFPPYPGRYIRRFIQRAAHDQLIFQSELSRAGRVAEARTAMQAETSLRTRTRMYGGMPP